MTHSRTSASRFAFLAMCIALLFTASPSFAQKSAPNLGTAATYGAFTGAGAIENTGLTVINGDIGTHVGSFTGFPPGIYTGAKHVADAASLAAKNDLILAYNSLNNATNGAIFDTVLGATMGNGQVLTPRTYRRGDLTTLSGNLTFDAKGDPAAVFIIKIGAALNVAKNTTILLANGARAENIYWAIDGAVSILDNTIFKGTILSNGAIHLYGGSSLEGRALAMVGAVTFASSVVSLPGTGTPNNNLVVITPAPGDTVRGGTQNYKITFGGTGIAPLKTFEYSLDSGATWTLIGTMASSEFSYDWDVPDTVSRTAFVRITDANNLRGTSGMFTIAAAAAVDSIIVVKPATGETVVGGTQNYQIVIAGSNISARKTYEYSLDGGATWILIGTVTSGDLTHDWDVPDVASTTARVRVTDQSGKTGMSGLFTIVRGVPNGSIIVVRPALGEVIEGGTRNYQIVFTATDVTTHKTFEYSLDGGATWSLIGFATTDEGTFTWANVPNVATTQALIRITDDNGIRGTSGQFTITSTPGTGSIDAVTLTGLDSQNNIPNDRELGISWTFTPDIGTSVDVEYTLDRGLTWNRIATVSTSASPMTTWRTPAVGSFSPVYIRVRSTDGMTATSIPFSISSVASVSSAASTEGYALSSYPNPASDRMTIALVLPIASEIRLSIIDARGSVVGVVASQRLEAGSHTIPFNGAELATGTYTYVLDADGVRLVARMNIIR